MTPTDAVYVYGVVPKGTSAGVFARVSGIDPAGEIRLVEDDDVAAITSAVPLEEFGLQALEANLRDPDWLEQKVQAHNQVLAAGVGETTVVPFRFGAIYNGEEQVRTMLSQRAELAGTLTRLRGALEFGVKGFLDGVALRERLGMRQGAIHRSWPTQQAVAHGLHVLTHHAQTGQLPQKVGNLLHDPGAAVLDRQHRRVHGAHRQRVKRQTKRRESDCLRTRKHG